MRYETKNRDVDIKKTKVKLNSNYKPDHVSMQFIENYYRAMYTDNMDMTKLQFYMKDPNKGNDPITPDQAVDYLESGYPILVKCDRDDEVFPFMKRNDVIYTGADLVKQERNYNPRLYFDAKAYLKEPKPKEPGAWDNFLLFFNYKTKTVRKFEEYQEKTKIYNDSIKFAEQYDDETDAYRYAEEINEYDGFTEEFKEVVKTQTTGAKPQKPEVQTEPVQVEAEPEITVEYVLSQDNLNINELFAALPQETKKQAPQLTPEQFEDYFDREKSVDEKRVMRKSRFFGIAMTELRKGDQTDEEIIRTLDELRPEYETKEIKNISTKAFVEYARLLKEVEDYRDEADKINEPFREEKIEAHTISQEELGKLSEEEQKYFEKQKDGNYIDRSYLEHEKWIEDMKVAKAQKKVKFYTLTPERHKILYEDATVIKGILKKISEQRVNALKNTIAETITEKLVAEDQRLDRENVYKTVRFGPTLQEMTATEQKTAEMVKLAEENPDELGRLYVSGLNNSSELATEEEKIIKSVEKGITDENDVPHLS